MSISRRFISPPVHIRKTNYDKGFWVNWNGDKSHGVCGNYIDNPDNLTDDIDRATCKSCIASWNSFVKKGNNFNGI